MPKPPRKSDVGFKHEAYPPKEGHAFWTVGGPALNGDIVYALNQDAAEIAAAALNFAHNFEYVKRQAARLSGELDLFAEFK